MPKKKKSKKVIAYLINKKGIVSRRKVTQKTVDTKYQRVGNTKNLYRPVQLISARLVEDKIGHFEVIGHVALKYKKGSVKTDSNGKDFHVEARYTFLVQADKWESEITHETLGNAVEAVLDEAFEEYFSLSSDKFKDRFGTFARDIKDVLINGVDKINELPETISRSKGRVEVFITSDGSTTTTKFNKVFPVSDLDKFHS